MSYKVLNSQLLPIGDLILENNRGATNFWADQVSRQIAQDDSNKDPASTMSMTLNTTDAHANSKLWNHTLAISFDNTEDVGSKVVAQSSSLLYQDENTGRYYQMAVYQSEEYDNYRTAQAQNAAIIELSKCYTDGKTFNQARLEDVVKYVFSYSSWSANIADDSGTVLDSYVIDAKTSMQAIIQDLQVKYNVDVDAYVELDINGRINNRVVSFEHIGQNNGAKIWYDSNVKGAESIVRTGVSDTLYTKYHISGVAKDGDTTAGSIKSVNGGKDYLVDDDANTLYNPVGAGLDKPTYLEVYLKNTLLSSPDALLSWGKKVVELFNHPRYNYTVTSMHDAYYSLGDTVIVNDQSKKPALVISSRVIKVVSSQANPETNTITLGEFSNLLSVKNEQASTILTIKRDITIAQNAALNAIDTAKLAQDTADKANQSAQTASQKIDETMAAERSRVNGLLDQQTTKIQGVVKEASDYTDSAKAEVLNRAQSLADEAEDSAIAESNKVRDGLAKEIADRQTAVTNANNHADTKISTISAGLDGLSGQFTDYKTSNNGTIITMQGNINANTSAINTKVSVDTFNSTTGDLQTKYGQISARVDSVTTTVSDVQKKNDQQDSDIAQVKVTADSITNWVKDSNDNLTSNFMTALGNKTIVSGSNFATSIQTQTSGQISSAVSTSETGMKSLISQKADSATVGVLSSNLSDLQKSTQWQQISYDDLNFLKTQGNYLITSGAGTNSPMQPWFYITVDAPRGDRITQHVWKDLDASSSYSRTFDGSNWSAWIQIANSSTLLSIFNDQWSLGTSINTSIGQKIATGIAGLPDGTLALTGKSIHLTGDTIVDGSFMTKALSTQDATIGKKLTIGSDGNINSDVFNMSKGSFDINSYVVDPDSAFHTTAYNTFVKINSARYRLNSTSSIMYYTGNMTATDSSGSASANFTTEFAPNHIFLMSSGWTDSSGDGYVHLTEKNITILDGGATVDKATNYSNMNANGIFTSGSIKSNGTTTAGNIQMNGYHAIVSLDGGKMYISTPTGQGDLGVKSLTQSSLVSTKEHIGNVDPEYALSETLKADIRQYNFKSDPTDNVHVTPMIDDVEGKMYIPKDWVAYEGDSVDTYTIIGYLVQSVKALQSQIDELKGK